MPGAYLADCIKYCYKKEAPTVEFPFLQCYDKEACQINLNDRGTRPSKIRSVRYAEDITGLIITKHVSKQLQPKRLCILD